MSKYKLIVIIGEAGAGKDTLLKKVVYGAGAAPTSIFHTLVSCTTRPRRSNEVENIDYHFITQEEFTKHFLNGDFLEATEFNYWFYGTLKSELKPNKINIAVLNPAGVESILLHDDIKMKVFYVTAPGKIRLIRQLQREEDPDIPEIYRRYLADDEDFNDLSFEYYPLTNCDEADLYYNTKIISALAYNWAKNINA